MTVAASSLTVRFHGTRGSLPTPGPGTVRYGGNTPCLTVEGGREVPLILDAGTGIRSVGRELLARRIAPQPIDILLSHTHWDHIQGLPFFAPLFQPGWEIRVFGPRNGTTSLETVLREQMNPAVFPIPWERAGAKLTVTEITSERLEVAGFQVTTTLLTHPGQTLGYRIAPTNGAAALAYMTDNELAGTESPEVWAGFVRFLRQTPLLIHDATYRTRDRSSRVGWGHSTAGDATDLAIDAGCRQLVLFHHSPDHDDRALEELLDESRQEAQRRNSSIEVRLAAEGMSIQLEEERP